jgi:hypothetical protein
MNEQNFFYKKEIIDEKKIGAQELMFRDAKSKQNNFFIASDNKHSKNKGSKKYTSFINIDDFLNYEMTLGDDAKNLYEMLTNELVEIYDIDGDYTKSSFLNDDGSPKSYDSIVNYFIDARIEFQDEYYSNIPLVRNNFIIKKTDDPLNIGTPNEKISLHIIIRNNMKFENNDELKKFTSKFKKYATTFYPKLIFDRSIYSKNRCIRILGHSKAGQTGRRSYRYQEFSSFNDICNRRLFFASYLEGKESYYNKIEDDDEFIIDTKIDPVEYSNTDKDSISKLINLILESIDNRSLSICDIEIKNKLNYCDWSKLVFTVFNCLQEELPKTIRDTFNKLFPYYRHSSDQDIENTWSNMSNYIGTYDKLTIKSLHYFARQNVRYEELFPEELKAHKEFVLELLYKKYASKANKTLESGKYPITYIHEFPRLVQLSQNNIYNTDYVQHIINSICSNVCNGGKNAIFAYTKGYDKTAKKDVSLYTINKYKNLNATGGFLNIRIRLLHHAFEDEFNDYKDQQKDIKRGIKFKKDEIIECPKIFRYRNVTADTPYEKSIISTMMLTNLFKTYRSAVFEPYLYSDDVKVYDDCLNLFTGFPHCDVLTDDSINSDLYTNSLIFENFKNKLCNGIKEPTSFDYVDNYIAHMIQKPSQKPDTMVILSGKQGTGKDLFISFIESMIGIDNVIHIDKMESLLKNFNTSIARKLLTKVNEISDKGVHIDKHDQLKEKITATYLTIEPKGFDSYQLDHVSRYFGFSNKDNILNIEESDRRFMMIKTENDMANNVPYHTEIKEEMDNINMVKSAFKYYATKDISSYQPRIIPNTEYKSDQKINSLPYTLKFLYYLFEETVISSNEYRGHADTIYADFLNWNTKMGNHKPVPRLNMVKDFERLGLVKERIKIKDTQKTGFKTSYDTLQTLFRTYLKDVSLTLPKN